MKLPFPYQVVGVILLSPMLWLTFLTLAATSGLETPAAVALSLVAACYGIWCAAPIVSATPPPGPMQRGGAAWVAYLMPAWAPTFVAHAIPDTWNDVLAAAFILGATILGIQTARRFFFGFKYPWERSETV